MALNLKLDVKLEQKLILTPSLQQAIKLLQLNRLELLHEIHQELIQNPTLEEINSDSDTSSNNIDDEPDFKKSEDVINPEEEDIPDTPNPLEEVEWEKYFQDDDDTEKFNRNYDYSNFVTADNFVNKKSSLTEHLLWQIGLAHISKEDIEIASKMLGFINDDGYLTMSDKDIADEFEISIEKVKNLVDIIQELDPVGVGARSLKECLLNQLITYRREFLNNYKSIGILNIDMDNAERIIEKYLTCLETKNYEPIQKALGLNNEQIEKAFKIIAGLEPKPGRQFNPDSPSYIIPDVFVIEDNDDFIILLNDDGIPKLKLSEFYTSVAKRKINVTQETKKFIDQKISSAIWFIKSIEQRKQTILNVAKQIVEFQKEFFKNGIDGLKPLTLQDVAQNLEIHESTVSRVIHNKYIHTPRGIYEMKYFFHGGLKTQEGENISSVVIKNMIKTLIQSENHEKPINDRAIADSLKKKGISIARRTVGKYRESMNILSCNQRKKEYKRSESLYRRV
jgi:RNA polymerase sigma-54 factor